MRFYDAHNHLQDGRLYGGGAPDQEQVARLLAECGEEQGGMVVNGTSESDWGAVLKLARERSGIIPAIGIHPWFVKERKADWLENFKKTLDANPGCVIGEIGLDKWIEGYDLPQQEEVFRAQLGVAAERGLPMAIHCLKAWGRLLEILSSNARPGCGFLLHSYGAAAELVEPLSKLGAYFSVSGYFALPRKRRQFEVFRKVPLERLLIETDAPDMCLPEDLDRFHAQDSNGDRINHPGNLRAIYGEVVALLGMGVEELSGQMEENFKRLFVERATPLAAH
jgi:TatD DNase family protein